MLFYNAYLHPCTSFSVLTIYLLHWSLQESKIVPLPQIGGMSGSHGPWPACLGTSGEECKDMIESSAKDVAGNVVVVTPEMKDSLQDDFDMHRVRVFVDSDGVVTEIPVRGR